MTPHPAPVEAALSAPILHLLLLTGLAHGDPAIEGAAEAWDEGYNAGFDNGVDAAHARPTTRYDNPYRVAKEATP